MITRLDYVQYKIFKTDYNCTCIGLMIYILLFIWMLTDSICFSNIYSGIVSVIWFMFIIYYVKEYNRLKKILSRYSKKEIKEYKRQNANIL